MLLLLKPKHRPESGPESGSDYITLINIFAVVNYLHINVISSGKVYKPLHMQPLNRATVVVQSLFGN